MPHRLSLRSICHAIAVLAFAVICCAQLPEMRTARVHLKLISFRGDDIGNGSVLLFKSMSENSLNLGSRFRNNSAPNIPFGTYRLKVYKQGFRSEERVVRIFQSDVWAVIQLLVSEENGPSNYSIDGSIVGGPSGADDIWIRAQGVYSDVIADTKVNNNGRFVIGGLLLGPYVITTRHGSQILDTRIVKIPSADRADDLVVPLKIEIRQKKGVASPPLQLLVRSDVIQRQLKIE